MEKLSNRVLSQLRDARSRDGRIWSGCPPNNADQELVWMTSRGLVEWTGHGYSITPSGRAALAKEQRE